MDDHEHDEHGNCILPDGQAYEPPSWKFDPWNIAGMVLTMVSGFGQVIAQGTNMMAQECWTHARWRKEQREAEEAYLQEFAERQEMAEAYERLVGMDTLWLEEEQAHGEEGS